MPAASRRVEERVRVLEDEGVALISIPVPKFSDSDPADIVHDFNRVRSVLLLTKTITAMEQQISLMQYDVKIQKQ